MRLLVDAQLPRRLVVLLQSLECDAIHTLDLPDGNATTDQVICEVADREDRIVVTKDRDFRNSHLLSGRPRRLMHITTGNMPNTPLLALIAGALAEVEAGFGMADFVELTDAGLIIHVRDG